ncbi:FkbM family methyltransferase [Mariprofundus sp. NF]|uniref:FkbM family methyltransferase n=1 Tax=Mariprofundus sp. NF TaxID=2608716 RepID=UPI0015A0A9F0|nr:FkbM family methyltransferase [Mariprofundus sp. NF]
MELTTEISKNILSTSELLMVFRSYLGVCDWHKAREYQAEIIALGKDGKIDANMLPALLIETCALPDIDQASVRDLHREFGTALFNARKHDIPQSYPAKNKIGGRLKIAYISADLNQHPVGCFINHIISSHLRDQFEVYCYAHLVRSDDITEHIRANVDHFKDITSLSDAQLAGQIHADGIHVAIDLGGLTTNTRIAALAHQPAPVQITYLGYPNTTGLCTIDYRITDNFADEDSDQYYVEKLLRMPQSFICYGFDTTKFASKQTPAESKGYITFGSFNHVRKLNPEVIATWCEILHRVEDSRLTLKAKELSDEIIKNNILREFEGHGITAERLHLQGFTERYEDNFKMYHDIDIALDTFPYNGTTTTCDALSIGVPVLTLVGKSHAQRVSYSILKNIGYEETITYSREEYIEKAVQLSQNPAGLSVVRSCLSMLFKHSIMQNSEAFTRQLETLISEAWCQKTGLPLPAAFQEGYIKPTDISEISETQEARKIRKLHIGGQQAHPEWEIFDANPSALVDHVGNANDLSRFDDNTFDALYSSHVLEHFSYQGELTQVLTEWHRVLKPEGTIYASVPNLEVLCELFLDKENLSPEDRFMVMRMMFGGQIDAYDFHKVGYNSETLASYLLQAGFKNVRMINDFGIFDDTSKMKFADRHISLNLIAEKEASPPSDTTSDASTQAATNTSPDVSTNTSPQTAASTSPEVTTDTPPQAATATSDIRIQSASWLMQTTSTKEIVIAEVGARIIDEESTEAPELFHNLQQARIIAFEPDVEACEKINTLTTGRAAKIIAYPYALGAKKGPQTLYVTNEGMCSSLYKPNEALLRLYQGLEVSYLKEEVAIEVIALDEFMKVEKITDLDFMKIDVQGAELDVFKGSEQALKGVIGICTEVEWSELYEDQPMFADVDSYLKSHGFQLHHLLGVGSRPMRGEQLPGHQQYLWSDAIYFPTLQRIQTLPSDKLIKLAAMTMMYQAYDLAAHTLKRYDDINKTELASIFCNALQPAK